MAEFGGSTVTATVTVEVGAKRNRTVSVSDALDLMSYPNEREMVRKATAAVESSRASA